MSEVMTNNWVPVEFADQRLWVEAEVLAGRGDGPLAPYDHITDGKLDYSRCFKSETFGHVYAGTISRFGKTIGTVADLTPVTDGAA